MYRSLAVAITVVARLRDVSLSSPETLGRLIWPERQGTSRNNDRTWDMDTQDIVYTLEKAITRIENTF